MFILHVYHPSCREYRLADLESASQSITHWCHNCLQTLELASTPLPGHSLVVNVAWLGDEATLEPL